MLRINNEPKTHHQYKCQMKIKTSNLEIKGNCRISGEYIQRWAIYFLLPQIFLTWSYFLVKWCKCNVLWTRKLQLVELECTVRAYASCNETNYMHIMYPKIILKAIHMYVYIIYRTSERMACCKSEWEFFQQWKIKLDEHSTTDILWHIRVSCWLPAAVY